MVFKSVEIDEIIKRESIKREETWVQDHPLKFPSMHRLDRAVFLHLFFSIAPLRSLCRHLCPNHSLREILIPQIYCMSLHVLWPFEGHKLL